MSDRTNLARRVLLQSWDISGPTALMTALSKAMDVVKEHGADPGKMGIHVHGDGSAEPFLAKLHEERGYYSLHIIA